MAITKRPWNDDTDLGRRTNDELEQIREVDAQVRALLGPLRRWQRETIVKGLMWYWDGLHAPDGRG